MPYEELTGPRPVLAFMGPSGVGKTTLKRAWCKLFPRFESPISLTDRPRRGAEREGVDYYYRSSAEIERLVMEGRAIVHVEFAGFRYATDWVDVHRIWEAGNETLLDLHIDALENVTYDRILPVFLHVSETERRHRLSERGDLTQDQLRLRLESGTREAEKAASLAEQGRLTVVENDSLPEALRRIFAIWEESQRLALIR